MESSEDDALLCQLIKTWCLDLTTIWSNIAKSKVVRYDNEKVGLLVHG